MKFFILASLILFGAVIARASRLSRHRQEHADRRFWEREREANQVRPRPLDDLDYIRIPWEKLPRELPGDSDRLRDVVSTLHVLGTRQIVNLTGYTNTDLKLKYGVANLPLLSDYDANYTLLACSLEKWAGLLWEEYRETEAAQVMEFAVSTMTDVRQTYYRLADYYVSRHRSEDLSRLMEAASRLRSSNRQDILSHLKTVLSHLEQRMP